MPSYTIEQLKDELTLHKEAYLSATQDMYSFCLWRSLVMMNAALVAVPLTFSLRAAIATGCVEAAYCATLLLLRIPERKSFAGRTKFVDERWPSLKVRWPAPFRHLDRIQDRYVDDLMQRRGAEQDPEGVALRLLMVSKELLEKYPAPQDHMPDYLYREMSRDATDAGLRCTLIAPFYLTAKVIHKKIKRSEGPTG